MGLGLVVHLIMYKYCFSLKIFTDILFVDRKRKKSQPSNYFYVHALNES